MESILSAPQNIPSPALGWFRKVVAALNHHHHSSNAVGDMPHKKPVEKRASNSLYAHFQPLSSLSSQTHTRSDSGSLPACCTQSITPCIHSANYTAKLAAIVASGSNFIPPPSRVHHDVNVVAPTLYWDYERASLESVRCDPNRYLRSDNCLGSGRYSQVYEGIDRETNEKCAIKVIRLGKAKRIRREVLILKNLRNNDYIVPFVGFQTDPETSQPALVFKCIDSPSNWREMFMSFSEHDVKLYMFQLLSALAFAHSKGVIHRDIKPQNVLFDNKTKKLVVIDWGLAEFYFPYQKYSTRVASRFFKSPEILLGYGAYDYSLDIWSAGCVFAGIIFRTAVFFRGEDDVDQLNKISEVLGTDDLRTYIRRFDMQKQCNLSPDVDQLLADLQYSKVPLSSFVCDENKDLATDDALELLNKMFVYNHLDRITAAEALASPYFNDVRNPQES